MLRAELFIRDSFNPCITNPTWRNHTMRKFILFMFLLLFMPSYANAQGVDGTTKDKEGIAMVYIMYDASLTRFHTPLDERTKNFNSLLGITIGAGTAFDTFINGVIHVSSNEIEEPLHPSFDFVSETQIWEFMGGLKLQDPNQSIFWDLLLGLNRHIYDFGEFDLGDESSINSFAISTSLNIPVWKSFKGIPIITHFGIKKAFHEDIGHINYSIGLKLSHIFTRQVSKPPLNNAKPR